MFKHTTKNTILFGFLLGVAAFVVEYLISDSTLGSLLMALSFFVYFGFLRPHIVGEQREAREREKREESQS